MSVEVEKDYERYLEKFCTKHHLTREEAEEHNLIKTVKRYYEKKGGVKNE